MTNKNIEWLQGDSKELDYHTRQYEKPKVYTKLLINLFKKWALNESAKKIIDIGCGAGANVYFFAKSFPDIFFYGIDLNPNYISVAL